MKSQASSPFEALNFAHLLRFQRDVRPPVQRRKRPRAFSMVSTGDSYISSSCEMKYEPTFKPLQGNPAFFESGQLEIHSTWGRKNRVPLTYLLLREVSSWGACGKYAYLFIWKQGMILILRWYGVHRTFLKLLYWNWWSSILETGVSVNPWSFLKGVKPLVLYDVDRRMVMETIQGNWPLLNLIWGTPSYFAFLRWHQCSSYLVTCSWGLSGVQSSKSRFLTCLIGNSVDLHAVQWNRASSCGEQEVSWVFSSFGRDLGYIPDLRRGCPFETRVCSRKSGHLSRHDGHLSNVN